MAPSGFETNRLVRGANFEHDFWLFIFENNNETFQSNSLHQYFKEFSSIILTTHIYSAIVTNESIRLFEVYRKQIGMDLIIKEVTYFWLYLNLKGLSTE